MGDFYADGSLVSEVMLSLTGLQEFFFPTGFKNLVRFSTEPEFSSHAPFGVLEVSHDASFNLVHDDTRSLFHSTDPELLEKLQSAYNEFQESRPSAALMLKNDITYRLHLKFDDGLPVDKVYKHIASLSGLFALLIHKPCHPENISLITSNETRTPVLHDLYPSLGLNKSTIQRCKSKNSHFHMPINSRTIDLPTVICEWFRISERFSTLVSAMQHETGFRTDHATEGNIVLFATQLESIAHDAGRKTEKYEYPLETHSSVELQIALKDLLKCVSIAELAVAVSDLRNEIAHIGKPRKYMNSLSRKHVFCVSICLELVVLGYVLDSVGVPLAARNSYQRHFLSQM